MAAALIAGMGLGAGARAWGQESTLDRGYWRAASHTAKEMTGDIAISDLKLSINFSRFTIAQIRELTPAEATAAFGAEAVTQGGGNLYRLEIPAEKRFAHHNTLCGAEETQWMATWSDGRSLEVAFLSGSAMPVFTEQALAQAQNVCELLGYER